MSTPLFVRFRFLFIILSFSLVTILQGQSLTPVVIEDIDFDDVKVGKYDWIQVEMKLNAPVSFKYAGFENMRNERYLDNVSLTLSLCYPIRGKDKQYEFYQTKVNIVSMEKGEQQYVYFYLPGVVVERDNIDEKPFAWMTQWEISGIELPLSPKDHSSHFSRIFKDKAVVDNFLAQLDKNVERNKGILLPEYLAPDTVKGRARNLDKSVIYARVDPDEK